MRILWLRPSKGDNISVRRERIAEKLRLRGYEIDIRDSSGLDAFGAIKQAITGKYDIISGNVRMGLYLGYPLARLLRTPFIGDVSDPLSDILDLPSPLFRLLERYEWFVLNRADTAVFVYKSDYRKALNRGIRHAKRLPNAVDYEQFADPAEAAVSEAAEILAKQGVNLNKPIAIYIGVFSSNYCIKPILETALRATDWEFVFLGEGELKDTVESYAESTENVYYPGALPYRLMPGFLSHADVGFCFKDAEQPLKLKEYGAAGLPIIVRPGKLSKWYDTDELVFVDPEPELITNRLHNLKNDTEMYNSYSEAGRQIATEWSWEEIADKYEEIFIQLTQKNQST